MFAFWLGGISQAFQRIAELDDWIMYLWAGLFSVSVILLLWQAGRLIYNWVRRHQNLEPLRFFVTYDGVLQDDALQFVFGIGGHYETRVANGLYKTTHTFLIGIKNASRNQFVSNCKVYLDIPDKDGSVPRSYLLVDTFTLNASEERFVPIVSYDEPATISSYKGSIIRLCIPVYGGIPQRRQRLALADANWSIHIHPKGDREGSRRA